MTKAQICRVALGLALAAAQWLSAAAPAPEGLDAEIRQVMETAQVNGLGVAVIRDGRVTYIKSFGRRNDWGEPLLVNSVMYGASLTKAVFAYTVMQLVDEGRLDLDTSIEAYLPRPLPTYSSGRGYARWRDLEGDERWRKLTPRILLSHRSGFANFAWLEPDRKLRFHFEPGSRYAYSGEGLMLLQFVLEVGLRIDVGQEVQRRVFDRFGMKSTSLTWRSEFAANVAEGYSIDGTLVPHDKRSRVAAAGSMDTSIEDFAKFAAAFVAGEGLSGASRTEMTRAQWPITTARQFPTLAAELPLAERRKDLAAGLGVVVFDGPQGRGFFKGGHNDSTGNTWVCLEASRSCAVLLSNDVRAEAIFPKLVELVLGRTGVPWDWEYGQ